MSCLTPFCLSKGCISAGPPLRLLTVHIPPAGQENGLQITAGPVVGHTHLQTYTHSYLVLSAHQSEADDPVCMTLMERVLKDVCDYRTRLLCDF